MDESAFVKAMAARGCDETYHIDWEASRVNPEHAHPFRACALVLQGAFTLTTPAGAQDFRAGDSFELPAGTPHTETVSAEGVRFIAGRLYEQ